MYDLCGFDLENHCAVETSVRPVWSGPANQTAVMSVTAVSMKYADISAPSSPLLNISIQARLISDLLCAFMTWTDRSPGQPELVRPTNHKTEGVGGVLCRTHKD